MFELLALGREGFEEWRSKTIEGGVSLDKDAVGMGEAGGERGA